MAEALQLDNLSYSVADQLIIDQVSVTLSPGTLVSLIGPNGAGKSTLLRLMTGYLHPSSGCCLLSGKPVHTISRDQLSRQRAMMRQKCHMEFMLPVRDVVAMGRAPWPGPADKKIVDKVMVLTGCYSLAQRDYRHLSGGEQQRVQLARALAQLWHDEGPQGWLFLDEPTSALDLYHQQHALRLLHQLTRKGRLAVCCVLHDLNLASLWSDDILLLHKGKLVADGTPGEVMTEGVLSRWYQADLHVHPHPLDNVPQVALRR